MVYAPLGTILQGRGLSIPGLMRGQPRGNTLLGRVWSGFQFYGVTLKSSQSIKEMLAHSHSEEFARNSMEGALPEGQATHQTTGRTSGTE